jgi:hypothetical protein
MPPKSGLAQLSLDTNFYGRRQRSIWLSSASFPNLTIVTSLSGDKTKVALT